MIGFEHSDGLKYTSLKMLSQTWKSAVQDSLVHWNSDSIHSSWRMFALDKPLPDEVAGNFVIHFICTATVSLSPPALLRKIAPPRVTTSLPI